MRRAVALVCCVLALAAAACEDRAPTPVASPADPSPTVTAEPTATTTPPPPSASTPRPTPSPPPTSTPTPTPTSTPSATPEATTAPTLPPYDIEFTPITRGEPRPLPAGLALYYWVYPCMGCDAGVADYRRIRLDAAVGAVREDRPLAFFDGASDREHYNPVRSFGVSESGQTLAATVCHAGYCEIEPVGGESGPTADTELRLWVSHDGGGTWEDQGQLLPQTRIIEVTDDDVLVSTSNVWRAREHWNWLTNEEWDAMLARLVPLGLDEREGWRYRYQWVASGERPDSSVVRTAHAEGLRLLAIPDQDGSVHRYAATDQRGGPSLVGDLLIHSRTLTGTSSWIQATTMELVDLATASIHEVEGLSLPFGLDIESADSQQEFYRFITARPEPTATPPRTPMSTPSPATKPTSKQLSIEPTQLERGDPRPMPIGLAVYYSIGNCIECCGAVVDHRRIVFDEASGTFREDRPLAFFDDVSSLDDHPVNDFRVSRSGQTLAATVCHVGYCMGWDGGPTPDAELHLWISRDGGITWADWGQLLPASRILEVTDDDVLVRSWNLWRTRTDWPWITDGDWDAMLARLAPVGLSDVEGRDERRYWVDSGEVHGSLTEPTPPAVGHITWYHHYDQPTDAVAWTGAWDGAHLLVFTDESGTIERVYAAQDRIGGAFVANDTLARSVRSYDMGVDRTTLELIDLTTLTIHDVAGLSLPLDYDHKAAGPQQEFYLFMTARPAQAAE